MMNFIWSSLLIMSLFSATSTAVPTLTCQTQSSPNPIAAQYPNLTTGTINGTVAVLPIPFAQARSIIPSKYPILTKQYESFLDQVPVFPKGLYPALLQQELDHDISNAGISIPDFTRAGISFPFVDRLNDGYTAMTYSLQILITTNPIATGGAAAYGNIVLPATVDPPCDAYRCSDPACSSTYFSASIIGDLTGPSISQTFARKSPGAPSPYPLEFYKNITNQPQFSSNELVCDNFIRLFNSSVTGDPEKIGTVKGKVKVKQPAFPETKVFTDVYGIQVDNAFIENNFMTCNSLKGYHGAGSGD